MPTLRNSLLLLSLLVTGNALAQYSLHDFQKLHIMVGIWQMPQEKGILYEVWEKQSDSLLTGRSFTVQGGDTIPEETTRLSLRNGQIVFTAIVPHQNGSRPVDFRINRINKSGFHFINRKHNFPQVVVYNPGKDSLIAAISGRTPKGYRKFDFRYKRVGN